MKALVTDRSLLSRSVNLLGGKRIGKGVKQLDIPRPTLSRNEILVKVRATALNPIDTKFIDILAPPGNIAGCDFAGVIEETGADVPSNLKPTDRVAGFVQGGIDNGRGAFAEYIKVESDLVWKIADSVSDEEAATYGISAATAMQALYLHLDVPWPSEQPVEESSESPIFIYAGSSAVGLFAIQLAKNAGRSVITTASPHSFELAKKYGADKVYDYHSTTPQDIANAHPNIARALDCFSEGGSTAFCAHVVQKNGGKVVTLLDTKTSVAGVQIEMIMSFQLLGRAFAWLPPVGPKYAASPADREALVRFYAGLNELSGSVRAPPVSLVEGGFEGVLRGLDRIREKKVSGSKLVVKF